MNYVLDGLKSLFADIGAVGWLVVSCYIAIFAVTLISGILKREKRKQLMAERQKAQKERHRVFMENHRMRKLEHQERMKSIQLRNAYYDSRRRINQINYNNLRTQGGKVYGKWK